MNLTSSPDYLLTRTCKHCLLCEPAVYHLYPVPRWDSCCPQGRTASSTTIVELHAAISAVMLNIPSLLTMSSLRTLALKKVVKLYEILFYPPEDYLYDQLKRGLIKWTGASEQQQLQQLLTTEELGDCTPSLAIAPVTTSSTSLDENPQLITTLTQLFDALKLPRHFSQDSPTRQRQSCYSSQLFSRPVSRLSSPYPYCWYHQRFGA